MTMARSSPFFKLIILELGFGMVMPTLSLSLALYTTLLCEPQLTAFGVIFATHFPIDLESLISAKRI